MTGQEYEIQEYKMRSKEIGHEVLTDNTDRNSCQLASGRETFSSVGITRTQKSVIILELEEWHRNLGPALGTQAEG